MATTRNQQEWESVLRLLFTTEGIAIRVIFLGIQTTELGDFPNTCCIIILKLDPKQLSLLTNLYCGLTDV